MICKEMKIKSRWRQVSYLQLNMGPVHTHPDIFESATFSFRIEKFPRSHVAYSNRIRLSRASDGIRIHSLCRHFGLLFRN